jgi:serine-aspartate repeat-containing protein C/D/E
VGFLSTLLDICIGNVASGDVSVTAPRVMSYTGTPRTRKRRGLAIRPRRCQVEALEPRRLMAGDLAPPEVLLGSIYFEEATGDDSQPDVIEVTFVGGAAGTALDRLVINGDKRQDGLTDGDIFFDTAAGGLGAFNFGGLSIKSANGFTVNNVTVVDGGSQIVFNLTGFDAGEKLIFAVDADEAQYVDIGPPLSADANSLVEGAEFQRSIIVGEFSAPGYVDLQLQAIYFDAFDSRFAEASSATGLSLGLPNDRYSPDHDFSDRTAGAVAHAPQIPLATLSGWVYHDRSDDGAFNRDSESGIGGVTLELLNADGTPTGLTTVTSTNPETLGFYEFRDLFPGTYGVREVQPSNWLDGKDTAGSHGGSVTNDRIFGAVLDFGDHAVNYNFGELLPGSIRGKVGANNGPECKFDNPDIPLEGVRIDLLDGQGNLIRFTHTNANGDYEFTGLAPGIYRVREHQPTAYYDGGERVGTAGGVASDVPGSFSIIAGINITSGLHAVNYDFCEKVGVMLSGYVYHDRSNDGSFDRGGGNPETGIAGVTVMLLDGNGVDTGLRATTDSTGFYKFNNLSAGTYTLIEIHPSGWLDGIDTPGNLGGVADLSPPGDRLSQVTINWGQAGIEYNFGELLPGSIRGKVGANNGPECKFDNPDIPLAGVRMDLLDSQGNVIAFTHTDANGDYAFTGLRPGTYSVREHQPTAYYDGGERVGSEGGVTSDVLGVYSITAGINLGSGVDAIHYDFCEKVGVMLSGYVYHDRSNDGIFQRDVPNSETGIPGVVVMLLDGDGVDTGLRATTDSSGFYKFNNLKAGTYTVMEVHPDGWLDGIDTPGNLGGVAAVSPPGDKLSQIFINYGQMGIEYNFGELLPGSIRGQVVVSTDPECDPDDGEPPIAGVRIDLLNANGDVIATTLTNSNGEYEFTGLRPGTYSVREHQPTGYFDLDAHLGSGDGTRFSTNMLVNISIGSDEHLFNYDFCEGLPASLSGYVYIDGAPIPSDELLTPDNVSRLRTGLRSADDEPLAGVTLVLYDTSTGLPVTSDRALPGVYPAGAITTVTDSNGFYQFTGLAPGNYAVVELPPGPFLDGFDHAGSLGGFAVNPENLLLPSPLSPAALEAIERFRATHGDDAIVLITLAAGQHSEENNFSELRLAPPELPPPPPLPPEPPVQPPEQPPVFRFPAIPAPQPFYYLIETPFIPRPTFVGGASALGYTWHLSVINAGRPRADMNATADARVRFTAASNQAAIWQSVELDHGRWTLAKLDYNTIQVIREEQFGNADAKAVVGDFNGDGVSDIAVYIDGHWFIDANGNGRWDEGDLWAKLGTEADLPVTGDWDADGKDDIGIYGPAWPRDPRAVANEPGLPDAENFPMQPAGKHKNMPPTDEDMTSGGRALKRTAQGQPRFDRIDHVFHYGTPGDEPVAGDWNGDGVRQIGVFRDGAWNLDMNGDGRFTEVDAAFAFGESGDHPVVGDFNGDGIEEVGVFRAGKWFLDTNNNRELDAQDKVFELGAAGDQPVVGDWNDDGRDDPGVYHPEQTVDRVTRRAG